MSTGKPASARWARLSLLLATLLYVIGGVAGPVVHVTTTDLSSVVAFDITPDDRGDTESGGPASHDELGCFVCQALGAPGVPAFGSAPHELRIASVLPASQPELAIPTPGTATPQARAPPAA